MYSSEYELEIDRLKHKFRQLRETAKVRTDNELRELIAQICLAAIGKETNEEQP
jgi:hypothetical protein